MSKHGSKKWRIALNTASLTDATRASTLAGIEKMAEQSALAKIPAIAASLASLSAKGATLATNVVDVATSETTLKANLSLRDGSRGSFDRELVTLKALVENHATNTGDVTGMGLSVLVPNKAGKSHPEPPAALGVKLDKAHGKARVLVQGTGHLGRFAAEMSQDPTGAGAWSTLPGTGKSRTLTGYPSGTKIWVRFATVRYGMQSDWCTPVLVTMP